jgi:hypothetical protein
MHKNQSSVHAYTAIDNWSGQYVSYFFIKLNASISLNTKFHTLKSVVVTFFSDNKEILIIDIIVHNWS